MSFDWNKVAEAVTLAISVAKPIAAAAFPGAGLAITLVEKIVGAAKQGLPDAMALVNAVKSGGKIDANQLKEYADRYEIAYQQLDANIDKRLAELDAEDAAKNKPSTQPLTSASSETSKGPGQK